MGTVQFQPLNMIYICKIVSIALGLSWLTTIAEGTPGTTEDTEQGYNCRAAPAYSSFANMDGWCKTNCPKGYCPTSHCTCDINSCKAVGIYAKHLWMDKWCEDNCRLGYCPPSRCYCHVIGPR